jgi:hypothetical protein
MHHNPVKLRAMPFLQHRLNKSKCKVTTRIIFSEYRVGVAKILVVTGNSENRLETSILTPSHCPNRCSGVQCLIN